MHIRFVQPYLSIDNLQETELAEFTVLIGRNGVGKTQLLQAIDQGKVAVAGVPSSEITLYDLDSFRPEDSKSVTWEQCTSASLEADRYLRSGDPAPAVAAKQILDDVAEEFSILDEYKRRKFEDELRAGINVLLGGGEFSRSEFSDALRAYNERIQIVIAKGRRTRRNQAENRLAGLIPTAMMLSRKLPHEVGREDILRSAVRGSDIIQNSLNHIFTAYKVDQFVWAHTEGERGHESFQVLMSRYMEMIRPPWVSLREKLDQMRDAAGNPELFNFEFSDPGEEDISFVNHSRYSFATRLTNRTTGRSYSTKNLSSGEKILMTLCLASFNWSMGCRMPKLVLLDEIDAMLHPSMVSVLVDSLKTLFVANGTEIIVATQSVTTAAVLDDGEIYRLSRPNRQIDIRPVTKSEAVSELSEGLATVDTGLRIALSDVAPVTILTEGNNSRHLKKWANLRFPDDVGVFDELKGRTGASQLSLYGELLVKMQTNSHFLIVWDCDARKYAERFPDATNVTAFAFEERENRIAQRGIENNYEEDVLKPFTNVTTEASTQREICRTLGSNGKAKFAEFIFENGTEQHFRHFGDLEGVVQEILEKLGKRGRRGYASDRDWATQGPAAIGGG